MTQLGAILAVCLAAAPVPAGEGGLEVAGPSYRAHVTGGGLDSLQMTDGNTLVRPGGDPVGLVVHRGKSECFPSDTRGSGHVAPGKPATLTHGRFAGLEDAEGTTSVRVDEQSGDLVLSQSVSNAGPGVWGVEWSIGQIPLDFSIIVPGYSGLRLTRTSVARRMDFAYPKTWEAQLVVIEGPGYGFYVWADDPAGRYKRLTVERDRTGWRLTFRTENDAPFDDLTECQSVPWRLNTYEGDWRVPARRYRDWAVAHFHPVPIGEQKPEWVRDMRTMVIMGMDQKQLDSLAARLDPQQTILYVPSWRAAGYDRDYPTYDKPLPPLKPFIDRAHALGFRVMLHVNYFGVDPKNPLYAQFEPYQLRDCFGTHERQWWLWTRAKPEIRFAYINPALKAWRDLFTERMARLCKDYHVDALHLDQTLCIDNDYNGRIDGLTMLEGNVALHRQLREALPEVALSGEGLNEVTYRYEAFAQRHAYGLSHSEGTWDRSRLAMAHPISSYLFRPYTIINGYLGCSPPSRGQLYAAWNEAYEHWGVIPTLKPQGVNLAEPKGFARQFFDEASFWQENRLEIDLDRPWPEEVPFPFRTAEGRPVDRTADGRMVCDGKVISQTVSGVSSLESAGMISGWRAYDQERLLGLDPERWYPVFPDARPKNAFHVSALPDGMIVRSIVPLDDMAVVRTASSLTVVADLVDLLETAKGGSRPFHGSGYEVDAPFSGDDGAVFQREASDRLFAHPPWRAKQTNPTTGKADEHGTGQTFARYKLDLPKATRLTFLVDVALRENAVGQPNSDGVTFRVCVRDGEREKHAEIHQATSTPVPLTLDLSELAGRSVDLELAVDPGPKRSVSFDWALWIGPRIEQDQRLAGRLSVVGPDTWLTALDENGSPALTFHAGTCSVETSFPGTVFFLRQKVPEISLPCDLASAGRRVCFLDETGQPWTSPATAGVHPGSAAVGGETRRGLFAHPPDGGRTVILIPVELPETPVEFRAAVGLRDGSKSSGVRFIMEANGRMLVDETVVPGQWHEVKVDLSPWRGKPVVLTLTTDSVGSFYFDWAHWAEPRLEEAGGQ